MKALLTTTAIALLASAPLLAQDVQPGVAPPEGAQTQEMPEIAQPEGAETPLIPEVAQQGDTPVLDGAIVGQGELFLPSGQAGTLHASELIGMDVHSSEADYGTYGANPVASADRTQWDAIGSVNDVVITADGQVQGILVDIGGFLGIGARTVALDMSQVHFLSDEAGVRFVAVNSTREALENAPEYQRPEEIAAVTADPAVTTPSAGLADPAAPVAMTRPALTREGFQDVDYGQMTADELQGATVYDANDDSIGNIGELILAADGTIDQVVVDVGGFLGLGAHSVALDFEELQIMRGVDGTNLRVYLDQTRESLEQRPAHEG